MVIAPFLTYEVFMIDKATKLDAKKMALTTDEYTSDREKLLNQASSIKKGFFGGDHFEKDHIRAIADDIDADPNFEGTGNQFLRYMGSKVNDGSKFPTTAGQNDYQELQTAAKIWKSNYQYARPLVGNMPIPGVLHHAGGGRW